MDGVLYFIRSYNKTKQSKVTVVSNVSKKAANLFRGWLLTDK